MTAKLSTYLLLRLQTTDKIVSTENQYHNKNNADDY